MEEYNNTWCLIRGSFANEYFRILKNFYVRQQVTRFIKQGYAIIAARDRSTLVAISPDKKELLVVTVNLSEQPRNVTYILPERPVSVKSYRTTQKENCQLSDDFRIKKEILVCELEAQLIQTFVVELD